MSSSSVHWPAQVQRLRVGDIEFDLRYRRVHRPDGDSELPQRMFDLLLLFAAEPGVVHSRSDLFQRIWCGVIVEDSNLSQSVWMLRRALGEQRRHWIRTVAKSGYVFDPPGPVVAIDGEPVPLPIPANSSNGTAPRYWPRPTINRPRALLAAVALAAIVLATGALSGGRDVATTPTIALVSVTDPGRGEAAATSLLHAWLEWRLSMLPEVDVLDEAHLASIKGDHDSVRLVLLSTGVVATAPNRSFAQARIEGSGTAERIHREGPTEQLPELIDAVAREAQSRLAPNGSGTSWPTLRIDAEGIDLHHRMRQAQQARNWVQAAQFGQVLAQHAPEFGLGQWHAAQVHARLNRLHAARQHLAHARAALVPLPASAQALFDAEQLTLDGRYQDAAELYQQLLRQHPHRQRLRLELASARLRAGQAGQASAALQAVDWHERPVSIQLGYHLLRARVELALGDPAAAREHAEQAERLAAVAGWSHERGFAAMTLAEADLIERRDLFDPGSFDRAAEHFEAAGDRMHALRARVLGAVEREPDEDGNSLDILLAQARDAGQHRLELEALRAVAYRHFRAGEIAEYRRRLEQTRTLARVLEDDLVNRQLAMDDVNEAFAIGRFDEVRSGLNALADAGLEGEPRFWARQFDALLAYRAGQLEPARMALESAIAEAEAGGDGPWRAMHRCLLGAVWLRLGDPSAARREYRGCADSKAPVYQLLSEAGIAAVELYSGDAQAAQRRLQPLLDLVDQLPSRPDRWLLQLRIAELLVRVEHGEQALSIYQHLLSELADTGYHQLAVGAHLGLAEIAASSGDWIAAEEQARLARRLLPDDDWLQASRLGLIEAGLAHTRGDPDVEDRLQALSAHALDLGDALAATLAMELGHRIELGGRDGREPQALRELIAVTGLRGARHDWLLAGSAPSIALASSGDGLQCPAVSSNLD